MEASRWYKGGKEPWESVSRFVETTIRSAGTHGNGKMDALSKIGRLLVVATVRIAYPGCSGTTASVPAEPGLPRRRAVGGRSNGHPPDRGGVWPRVLPLSSCRKGQILPRMT